MAQDVEVQAFVPYVFIRALAVQVVQGFQQDDMMIDKQHVMPAFDLISEVVKVVLHHFVNALAHRYDAVFVVLALPYKDGAAVKVYVFGS